MSWLRVDDGFANHPKIARLTDRELRIWIRTLCYCARYENPAVDDATMSEVVGLKPATVQAFVSAGLLDVVSGRIEVHDWHEYQPKDKTGAERQKRWRERNARVTTDVTDDALPRPVPSRKDPSDGVTSPVDERTPSVEETIDRSLRAVT